MQPRVIQALLTRIGLVDAPLIPYGRLIRWLFLYWALWLTGGTILFLVADAVYPLSLSDFPYVLGSFTLVGTLSVLIFFLPSNFGFTEVGLSLLLSAIMPSSIAVLVAVLNRVLLLIFELIGLGLIMLSARARSSPHFRIILRRQATTYATRENTPNGVGKIARNCAKISKLQRAIPPFA